MALVVSARDLASLAKPMADAGVALPDDLASQMATWEPGAADAAAMRALPAALTTIAAELTRWVEQPTPRTDGVARVEALIRHQTAIRASIDAREPTQLNQAAPAVVGELLAAVVAELTAVCRDRSSAECAAAAGLVDSLFAALSPAAAGQTVLAGVRPTDRRPLARLCTRALFFIVEMALFVLVGVLITVNVMARAPMIANGTAIADVLLSPRDVTADNPLTILR